MTKINIKEPTPEEKKESEEATAAARKILKEAKKRATSAYVEHEFMGVRMFIREMSYMDNTDFALSVYRDGFNILHTDLTDREAARSITICMLMHCIYTKEGDKIVPAFTHADLEKLIDTPGANDIISALWEKANEVNPMVFTTLKKIVSE